MLDGLGFTALPEVRWMAAGDTAAAAENRGMQISQQSPASVAAQPPVAAARGVAQAGALAPVRGASDVGAERPVQGSDAAGSPDALVARLDAFGAGLAAHIGQALAALPSGGTDAASATLGRFDQSLARIRAGIEDGSLRGESLGRALDGALAVVRHDLARAREVEAGDAGTEALEPADAGADATATAARAPAAAGSDVPPAASAQGRFGNIVSAVTGRLASLAAESGDDSRTAEVAAAQESFASAAARIETAFFERGEFDRGTFYGLLSASLGRLQQRLSDLQSGAEVQEATLYDARRGVESLSDGLRRVRFDRTV